MHDPHFVMKFDCFVLFLHSFVYMHRNAVMAEWLQQASQLHEMHCLSLAFMGSNPTWIELRALNQKYDYMDMATPELNFSVVTKYM